MSTADAAHVAAVESALAEEFPKAATFLDLATVAVETLTPLIRAQVAAEILALPHGPRCRPNDAGGCICLIYRVDAARIIEATP